MVRQTGGWLCDTELSGEALIRMEMWGLSSTGGVQSM